MESLQDQIAYGNFCIHGVNIGTPGGADLMCGACEDGYTTPHTCANCGEKMWRRYDETIECVPNVAKRADFAQAIRKLRGKIENATLAAYIRKYGPHKFNHVSQ